MFFVVFGRSLTDEVVSRALLFLTVVKIALKPENVESQSDLKIIRRLFVLVSVVPKQDTSDTNRRDPSEMSYKLKLSNSFSISKFVISRLNIKSW